MKLNKHILFSFAVLCLIVGSCPITYSQTLVATVEAESGTRSGGVTISTAVAGYSGTGYVTNFRNTSDQVTITVNIADNGFYTIIIRYNSTLGNKTQNLIVNNGGASSVVFPQTTTYSDLNAGKYLLNAGINTITIQSNWGWMDIDKFTIYTAVTNTYNTTPHLVDPKATAATKSVYNFLYYNYRKRIISGQTDGYYDSIKILSGKSPVYRTWDFYHYTEGYPYLWKNGGFSFGVDPSDHSTDNAIAWYNSTGKKGIVGFHWHWCSPSGGTVGTNTFYTANTTFDITKAVQPGTTEYTLAIRDIDTIAFQLKKLQTAGVPVLWRPLHEAGGTWFWWGAKGGAAVIKLYKIMYDRLTNYHQLHNLIWVWSTYETDHYPGNDFVDIVGMDSYPGNYNYSTQKNTFDIYNTLTGAKKIVAMSENGPIPDPNDCLTLDAPWSFFMSWNELVRAQNSKQHIKDVFSNPSVLTLDTLNKWGVPAKPQTPAGATDLKFNPENQTYTTHKTNNATSYIWEVTPDIAATITGTDTSAVVDFSNTFSGKVKLTVTGKNILEYSGVTSDTLTITVAPDTTTNAKLVMSQDDVKILTNASLGNLEILVNAQNSPYSIQIFDMQGREIFTQKNIMQNSLFVNTSNYPKGIYIITIKINKALYNNKLLIL